MANTYVSDQINTIYSGVLGGTATAGVAGGPVFPRATEVRGIPKVQRFTFEAASPNPIPGGASGALGIGDIIVLGWLFPTERIYFGRLFVTTAFAASTTLSVGKIDNNNASNTDSAHYLALSSVAATGSFDFNVNMTEQVGADPLGDQTTGNLLPQFGSAKIWVTATFAGAAPGAAGILVGYFWAIEEGN